MILIVDIWLWFMAIYLMIGLVFGIYFIVKGAEAIDPDVAGTPWHFRLIILPGSILLWWALLPKIFKSNDT